MAVTNVASNCGQTILLYIIIAFINMYLLLWTLYDNKISTNGAVIYNKPIFQIVSDIARKWNINAPSWLYNSFKSND